MSIETRIDSDLQRLAKVTLTPAPSLSGTAHALHTARAERASSGGWRWAIAAAVAVSGLVGAGYGSTVYAFARELAFHIALDLRGKSDEAAAEEIRRQLGEQGWKAGEVSVQRTQDEQRVSLQADDDTGHHVELHRVDPSGVAAPVVLAPEPIDDTREPGMTDAQLRAKILRQLRDRGVEHAEVSVSGDDVRILVKRAKPE